MAVNRYTDVYAPRFFIEVDGKPAPDIERDVVKFVYVDSEKESDQCTLTLNNRGLKYIDDPRFEEGIRMRVRWGYPTDVSETRQLVISKAKPDFPSGAQVPTMTLMAWDLRRELNRGGNPKNWGAISSSAVAKQVADRYSLRTEIEESGDARKESRIQAANVTDIQYLLKLADQLNWDCYIHGDVLHFHKKRFDERPMFEYTYFTSSVGTLLKFDPQVKMSKPSKTGKAGADPTKGDTNSTEAETNGGRVEILTSLGKFGINTSRKRGEVVGSRPSGKTGPKLSQQADAGEIGAIRGGFNLTDQPISARALMRAVQTKSLISATPETDAKVIKQQAAAKQSKIDMTAVEATIEVVGTPKLRATQNVSLKGVGQRYSGNWRVSKSTHTIVPTGNIYTVSCTVTRNALNKGKKDDKNKSNNTNNQAADSGAKPAGVVINTSAGIFRGF